MMTITEMHVEFDTRLQTSTARKRNLGPEEKDLLLNEAIRRFINARVTPNNEGPRFQINTTNTSEILSLLETKKLKAFEVNGAYKIPLPGNFDRLIADASHISYKCGSASLQQKTFRQVQVISTILTPTKANTEFYKEVQVFIDNAKVYDLKETVEAQGITYTGFKSKEEGYHIPQLLLEILLEKGYYVYYERWGDIYKPNALILVNYEPASLSMQIKIDGETLQSTSTLQTLTEVVLTDPYKKTVSDNRTLWSSQIDANMQDPYRKSSVQTPISEIENGFIAVLGDSSFIVNYVTLRFIKKFRKVSIILGRNCDLPGISHSKIVDLAVELAKALLNTSDLKQNVEINRLQQ